jgi:hypothetical protein
MEDRFIDFANESMLRFYKKPFGQGDPQLG